MLLSGRQHALYEPDGYQVSRGRWLRRALTAIALTVLVLAVASLVYRRANRVWPWSTYPTILHICNRDFAPQTPAQTPSEIASQGYHLVRHGNVPGWFNSAPVWGYDAVDGHNIHRPTGGCPAVVWVQGGSTTYQPYVLQGGP